jgi:hypothetical protein
MPDGNNSDGAATQQNNTEINAQPWKTLGYDSFDAYESARKAEVEKIKSMHEEAQKMISRQGEELGKLRKEIVEKTTIAAKPAEDDKTKSEDEYKSRAASIYQKLDASDIEKATKAIETLPEDVKGIVTGSYEGKCKFLEQLFSDKSKPESTGVFSDLAKAVRPKTIEERIKEAMDRAAGPRTTAAPDRSGIGQSTIRKDNPAQPPTSNVMFNGLYPG